MVIAQGYEVGAKREESHTVTEERVLRSTLGRAARRRTPCPADIATDSVALVGKGLPIGPSRASRWLTHPSRAEAVE